MSVEAVDLSVVIPCYNDGRFLMDAVESVESNRRGRHELIIVNDGSSDRTTLDVLSAVESTGCRVIHQENRGLAGARNRGILEARGRYVLPLDADNRIRPAYIDEGISTLDADSGLDVVYGDAELFGDKTGRRRTDDFRLPRLLGWNYIDACAVFRKAAWERCGGYDEGMPIQGFEDWDLWCRIACTGGRFRHLDEVLYDYRVRGDSMSREMMAPEKISKLMSYMRSKKIELALGDYMDAYVSWDPLLERFRRRPVRTLMRLLVAAWAPHWNERLKLPFYGKSTFTSK
jgi:glycosyltransferase involved in cell wall biosynthesis